MLPKFALFNVHVELIYILCMRSYVFSFFDVRLSLFVNICFLNLCSEIKWYMVQSLGKCSNFRDKTTCLTKGPTKGVKCSWSKERCVMQGAEKFAKIAAMNDKSMKDIDLQQFTSEPLSENADKQCLPRHQSYDQQCKSYYDCQTCVSTMGHKCKWCSETRRCSSDCSDNSLVGIFSFPCILRGFLMNTMSVISE